MNRGGIRHVNDPDIAFLELADRGEHHGKLVFGGIRISKLDDLVVPVIEDDVVGACKVDLFDLACDPSLHDLEQDRL